MPPRPQRAIINTHKAPIDLLQALKAILNRLGDIVGARQRRLLIQQDIQLDPDAIASMIRCHGLVSRDDGGEAPGEKEQFALDSSGHGGAGQARDILQRGVGPVIDDVEGEQGGAEGIEPPDVGLCADEGEEERGGVEVDVGFAVLDEGLDLCGLDAQAAEADDAFDEGVGDHGGDGDEREGRELVLAAGEESRDGFLEDLEEGNDHDDGEDEDAEGLEAATADGEFLLEAAEFALDELTGGPYDQGAEKV